MLADLVLLEKTFHASSKTLDSLVLLGHHFVDVKAEVLHDDAMAFHGMLGFMEHVAGVEEGLHRYE